MSPEVKEAYAVMRAAWPAWAAKQDVDSARIWCELVEAIPHLVQTVKGLAGKCTFAPSVADLKEASGMYRPRYEPPREEPEKPLTDAEMDEIDRKLAANLEVMLKQNTVSRDAAEIVLAIAMKQRHGHNKYLRRVHELDRKRRAGGDTDD